MPALPDGVEKPLAGSLSSALRRADREAQDSISNILVNQLLGLHTTGSQLQRDNYQRDWNEDGVAFYEQLFPATERFYQQLHAAVETTVHMLRGATTPELGVGSLARLLDVLEGEPSHPLGAPVRARRRQIALLRWLGTVRNKAVQHPVQQGYTRNSAIVLPDAFVLVRKPGPAPAEAARRAKRLLRGLTREYDISLDETEGTHENLAYLDLVSHELLQSAPGRADPARAIVENARVHHIVVSRAFLVNADWALTALVELVPQAHG